MTSMSSTDGMDIGRIGQFKIALLLKEGRTYQNRWSLAYQKSMYKMFMYIEVTQTSTFCQKSAPYFFSKDRAGGGLTMTIHDVDICHRFQNLPFQHCPFYEHKFEGKESL